jgi:hypothetical protein
MENDDGAGSGCGKSERLSSRSELYAGLPSVGKIYGFVSPEPQRNHTSPFR